MSESPYDKLARKTTIDDIVKFEGEPAGKVEDEVSRLDEDGEYKYFVQKIRLGPKKARQMRSKYAYRWCYWTVTGKGDRLSFGQYALFLSERSLRNILARSRKKGWPICSEK